MSKYGSLRSEDGHSKLFLTKTLDLHDRTMEHPLMQAIYDKKITDHAYAYYLRCLLQIFEALEGQANAFLPASLNDPNLNRVAAIKKDLVGLYVDEPHLETESSAVKQYFKELMTPQKLRERDEVICHHFLHYNAMLSGGAYLGSCLQKINKPRALYNFDLGKTVSGKPTKSHEYVRDYMGKLDAVEGLARDDMIHTMRR